MRNKDVVFPFYSGNIKLTRSIGLVDLNHFIGAHINPKQDTINTLEQIRNCKLPRQKRLLKHKLYSFTPSVFIGVGQKRNYGNVQYFTGLMQIDLDDIEDTKTALDLKTWLFDQKECVTSYFSPSGDVKGLIRISPPKTVAQYKRIHNAVTEKYETTGYFDTATKNAVLPLFLSADPLMLFRDISECTEWIKEKEIVIEHEALNELPPPNFNSTEGNREYFYNRTLRILRDKINSITSEGHPQVRSAALILGSRVAADYLTAIDARIEIKNLILTNSYLSKGPEGYIETAMWGIKEGMKNPKYY